MALTWRIAKWAITIAILVWGITTYVAAGSDHTPHCAYDQIDGATGPNCGR